MWNQLAEEFKQCTLCKADGLLDPKAFPILMKQPPRSTDILFILEAPNRDDTYNPRKGYLTVEPNTDPSGRFFHDLFINELQFSIEDLFVTNSVLCLPARKKDKYPVSSAQRSNCIVMLRRMIDELNPKIVCPMGTKALKATDKLENHGYSKMETSVANPTSWYGRILFPLFHTSGQARNPRNGRPETMQRKDWRRLRSEWERRRAQQTC